MRRTVLTITLLGGLLCMIPVMHFADAHHSTTMFDHARTMTIKGDVIELRWVNPHATLLVKGVAVEGKDVATDGKQEEWLMEMTSPGNLVRAGGWSRSVLKKGDEVVVEFSPLRDTTSAGGALKKVTVVKTGLSYTANIRMQEMPGLE